MPKADKEFVDSSGFRVQVTEETDDVVWFCAQGGGFRHRVSKAAFLETFKPAGPSLFKEVLIQADHLPDGVKIKAYSNGRSWNGWAMPYFELDAGLELVKVLGGLSYDQEADVFVFNEEGLQSEDIERFNPHIIEVEGKCLKTYPIGTGSWCWEIG